jgi:hypothetical protein
MATHASLRGRGEELGTLDRLLEAVRAGESRALVLRGEPGVGKTALLDYAIESASEFQVARAVGVESEIELAYAALHQLCAPLLDRIERLPGPQRDALAVTFGLSPGAAPDRFLVGLAVLTLFRMSPTSGHCSALSTMRSGSTGRRLSCSRSWRDACSRIRSRWCSRRAT